MLTSVFEIHVLKYKYPIGQLVQVNRIKMDFTASRVKNEDFVSDQIKSILLDASKQLEAENECKY